MGFFRNLFSGEKKKKTRVPRNCGPVRRLASKRGCSVGDLDLDDDNVIAELLLLGLFLSSDGNYYEDYNWNEQNTVEVFDTNEPSTDVLPEPAVTMTATEPEVTAESAPEVIAEPASEVITEPVPDYVDRHSWTDEPSSSDWSDSSDFGGGFDSGGFDD